MTIRSFTEVMSLAIFWLEPVARQPALQEVTGPDQ